MQYELSKEYPSYSSHRYLHEKMIGREDLVRMDALNRKHMKMYIDNILIMEEPNAASLAPRRELPQVKGAEGRA